MISALASTRFTATEYLALERASDQKHQFVDGAIIAIDFDRGKKFLHYQSIPEFRDYVIVSHRERRIDHYRREGDGQWRLTTHTAESACVQLPDLGSFIALADVYSDVDLTEGMAP